MSTPRILILASAVTVFAAVAAAGSAYLVWSTMQATAQKAPSNTHSQIQLSGNQPSNPGSATSDTQVGSAPPQSTAEIVKRVASGVFFITAYDALDQPIAVGTGCCVGDDRVATNRHVVENAVRVSVKQKDGTELPVQGYCSSDTTRDLALMIVSGLPDTAHRFTAVGGANLVQGDQLTAIGHPKEFSFSVSDGIVSAIRETTDFPELYQAGLHANPDTRWIQTTAAISNGSSGGPLLNNRGELVGINTWIAGGQNLGFAIDAVHLIPLIESAGGQCHLFPLQDSSVIVTTEVAKLQADFLKEYANLVNNLRAAGSDEASRLVVQKQNPIPIYLEKLLRLVQDKPDTPQCWDAIMAAHGIWASSGQLQAGHQYLRQIYTARLDSRQIPYRALLSFAQAPYSIELERRLREVLDNSDSPQRTAAAGYALLSSMNAATDQALTADIRLLKQRLIEEVGDQEVAGYPLHQLAEQVAAGHGNGAIGTLAPEIEGEDFAGETFRLSDYRDKVVLLDFWVDWCPHCRNMYPAERELVEQMRDKPFALLGVNSDEPQRARAAIDSGQVTWRSWVDSPPDSPIAGQWSVDSYPTMYLLDGQGVVRFKFEGAEDFSSEIDFLMQESLLSMPGDVLATGSTWSYRDAAGIEDAPWTQMNFDDSSWNRQQGPIAYNRPDTRGIVDEGWSEQIPTTLLVRSRFELSDAAAGKPLIAKLRFDDAVVLFVNGREVYRSNLADSAGLESPAAGIAGEEQHQGVYFPIPAQYLKAGENVISASVHQANEFSADLLFGLSLSSRVPDKTPILESNNASIIAAYCRMLSDLLPIDPYLADLKALVESPEPAVKLSAWWSAARGGKSLEMDWDSDPQMRQQAIFFAAQTLAGSMSHLTMKDLSGQDYRKLARNVHASKSLLNAAVPGNENVALMVDKAMAVAMYRMGRFQAALDLLTGAAVSKQPAPTIIAYTALCYARLNNQDEADKALKRFLELLKQPQWQHDAATAAALEELRLTFDLPESKPVIADVPVAEAPQPDALQTDGSQRQVQSPETDPRIAERDRLRKQAMALAESGKLDQSKELFERVYQMEMSSFGDASEELDGTLNILLLLATALRDDQAIIGIRQRQLTIAEKRYGKDDYRAQDAARAFADAKQRATFTPEQKSKLAQADVLRAQTKQAYQQGQHAAGIRAATECLALQKHVLGDNHPHYAASLNNLATLYDSMGDYPRAEPLYRESLAIKEKSLGKEHPDYATSLNSLAGLYYSMGDYPRAEPLYREAMAIDEKVLGKEHPDYANSLNRLAILYYSMGDYPRAEPLYREAMAIREKVLGKEHPDYAASLNNLGELYRLMGDYLRAEPLHLESMAIREKVLGKEHPDYANSLNNLAALYASMCDYRRGESFYRETLAIEEKVLGKEHPSYATSVSGLAGLYNSMGDYLRAEPLYREAMAIQEKVLGKEHPDYATSLNSLARLYDSMGDYLRAEPLYREAMAIDEKVLGKEHPDYATSLNRLAILYYSVGDYPQAEGLYREAMAIREKVLGKEHPDYATSLNNLAALYASMGDYRRGESLYREALAIKEKVLGKEHPDYAGSLNNLAALYVSMSDYPRAEPLHREAMAIQEKVLGKEHRAYATSLNNLAGLYKSMGDYPRAEPLYREAMAIDEKVLGKEHPDYATSLNRLAGLYHSMGDYARAEPLYREAMAIDEKVLGKEHPDYAISLDNLATLYKSMGDYRRAEPLHREAMAIQEKVLGKEHRAYATSLNNLAGLYKSMGDYPRAEPLYHEALAITEKVLGKEHPDYAISLDNLAILFQSMGDYRRAEPLCREALAVLEKVLGKEHPDYATSLNNLAALYASMGDYRRGESLYREAMAIQEKVLGKEHPGYAISLDNLAALYSSMGEYPRAEPLHREALPVLEKVLGKEHPSYARSLANLAGLYQSIGDYPRAEPLLREVVDITLQSLELTADVQSQRQQVRMAESQRVYLDNYVSLAVREPQFQTAAYGALLRWKGSVWQRQQRGRLLIDEPSLKPRFAALQQVSSKLSTLLLRVPEPNQREAWRRQLDELTDEREKLERDLSLASVAFRQASTPVTPEQMRDSLPNGTMLVDFLEYEHFMPANNEQQTKESYEQHLLVHLVRGDQEVRAIDLGPVDAIADLVQSWRRDLGASPAAADAAKELRQRIWEPLAEHLSGITMVYVSPDGVLGQFPLAALPGKQPGSYLIEEIAIVILPVPQVLASMNQAIAGADEAGEDRFCLVGGVDYDQVTSPTTPPQPTTPTSEPAGTGPPMLALRTGKRMVFTPLPGTVGEIETIESLLQKHRPSARTTILSGAQASEAAFSRVAPGNRYLHIATHGFFAPPTVQNALTATKPDPMTRMLGMDQSRFPQLVGEHPDLLSGLVFAGANKPQSGDDDDGILTAAEVQSLDLRGVELAILSACETGLGATAGGEGIIGLQRAFQLAGAETTITSLWQVDDAATKALMVEFYENLFERKLGKYESLRKAQLTMLNHYDASTGSFKRGLGGTSAEVNQTDTVPTAPKARVSPAYWAAFQLSGDWR